jgi:hypothetical protein
MRDSIIRSKMPWVALCALAGTQTENCAVRTQENSERVSTSLFQVAHLLGPSQHECFRFSHENARLCLFMHSLGEASRAMRFPARAWVDSVYWPAWRYCIRKRSC